MLASLDSAVDDVLSVVIAVDVEDGSTETEARPESFCSGFDGESLLNADCNFCRAEPMGAEGGGRDSSLTAATAALPGDGGTECEVPICEVNVGEFSLASAAVAGPLDALVVTLSVGSET